MDCFHSSLMNFFASYPVCYFWALWEYDTTLFDQAMVHVTLMKRKQSMFWQV